MSELRERLNKVVNRLEELESNPSELTRDALLADLRGLYDTAKETNVSNTNNASTVVAKEEEVEEKVVEPEPVAAAIEPDEPEEEQMPRPAAQVEEKHTHPQDEMKVERPQIPDPPVFEEVEDTILAQRRSLIGTIEDSEKPNDDMILAGQLRNKPMEDLRTGIPLNEKFGIIRGLFNGNASDFGDAVLKLNNASTPDEMDHYLGLLEKRFGWDVDSEPYLTFLSYIERKMMTLQVSNADSN